MAENKNKTGYVGVYWVSNVNKYRSAFTNDNKEVNCGTHETARGAALLRDKKILALNLDDKYELQILKKAS